MNAQELASIALKRIKAGEVGEIPARHLSLIQALQQREASPSPQYYLSLSLASAIVHGVYLAPSKLEDIGVESLARDCSMYYYFEGICLILLDEHTREAQEAIVHRCNDMLNRGIVVDGVLYRKETLNGAKPTPFHVAAAKTLHQVLHLPGTDEVACIFVRNGPLERRVRIYSNKGIIATKCTTGWDASQQLAHKEWWFDPAPKTFAQLVSTLDALNLSPEHFFQEIQMEWMG